MTVILVNRYNHLFSDLIDLLFYNYSAFPEGGSSNNLEISVGSALYLFIKSHQALLGVYSWLHSELLLAQCGEQVQCQKQAWVDWCKTKALHTIQSLSPRIYLFKEGRFPRAIDQPAFPLSPSSSIPTSLSPSFLPSRHFIISVLIYKS